VGGALIPIGLPFPVCGKAVEASPIRWRALACGDIADNVRYDFTSSEQVHNGSESLGVAESEDVECASVACEWHRGSPWLVVSSP
jgi:hypothetical protein